MSLGPTFPAGFKPTSRSLDYGDFPVKKYKAQDGAEYRILYGDRRVSFKMELTFANISDTRAQLLLQHYHDVTGTFKRFLLGDGESGIRAGWEGDKEYLAAGSWGSLWRYEKAPQLKSVYPGVSTVTISLIAATP